MIEGAGGVEVPKALFYQQAVTFHPGQSDLQKRGMYVLTR